ncbi:site-2 protease family protein [Euzebya tangerina]|uniref:site-2 protease family protein n=1 Tax=Euzebya tangerina TaxID=591198 RepID=UPI002F2CC996
MYPGGRGGKMALMRGLRFRIGDIPVRVDLSFWLIMGLFGFQRAALTTPVNWTILIEWIILVFVGILLHELGHAVSFRAFGRQPSVVLYGMGGLTSASGSLSPGKRLITTLAGPFFGFALAGIVLAVFASGLWQPGVFRGASVGQVIGASLPIPDFVSGGLGQQILVDLIFINLGWGILNLVPMYPLDGGQSLEATLQLVGVKQAERITSAIGLVFAAGVGVWALQNGQIFLLLIVVFLAVANAARLRPGSSSTATRSADQEQPRRVLSDELANSIALAEQALSQGRAEDAVEVMAQEYTYRPTPDSARLYLAVLARTRSYDQIEELLQTTGGELPADAMTTAASALVAGGRFESGLYAAERAWNLDQGDGWGAAVTAAAARAGVRDVDGAIRWLYTAADRGWTDRRRLESDPLFAEVRADPRMMDIVGRMESTR